MPAIVRFFWSVTLVAFLSGCASYRYVSLPSAPGVDRPDGASQVVEPRSTARVTLTTGETISGEVVRATEAELVLDHPGNFGFEELVFPAADIATIEVEYTSTGSKVVILSLVGATALAIFVGVSLADGLEEGLGGLN